MSAAANVLVMAHGYVKDPSLGIVPKPFRPTSIGEAKRLIEATFEKNRWDEDSRLRWAEMKIGEAKALADLTPEETRIILAAFEKARMVIFQES